jgi:hypothetical protein
MGENRRFIESNGEGFFKYQLQDERAIPVISIMFIVGYPLVLPDTITWEGELLYRCGGLKPS